MGHVGMVILRQVKLDTSFLDKICTFQGCKYQIIDLDLCECILSLHFGRLYRRLYSL